MTFCLGMKVEEGLVGIADTRITTGTQRITARKVSIHEYGEHPIFVMTSGLRSVRDKALTYFEEVMEENEEPFDKLYKAVNSIARQIRRVAKEDKKALAEAGLRFNLHALVGGQLARDEEHKLYMLYPQGNWVEVGQVVEDTMLREKGIFPNVDFPCAYTYYMMGIPIPLYTPIFVSSRVAGWAAHVIEQHDNNRLIRPNHNYTGPEHKEFKALDQRA